MNEAEQREAWIKFASAALGAILTHDGISDIPPKDVARLAKRYATAMLAEADDMWGDQ
jgi:hypothetical protein